MKKSIRFVVLVEFLLLLSIIWLYYIVPNGYNKSLFLFNFVIVVSVLFFEIKYSYIRFDQRLEYWLRPSFIFLIGYLIVGYQYYLDVYVGFLSKEADILVSSQMLNKGICFSSLGLLAFSIGNITTQKPPYSYSNNVSKYTLLLILNVLLFLWFLMSVDSAMLSGETYVSNVDEETIPAEFFLNIIQFSIIAQYSINNGRSLSFFRWVLKMPYIFLFTLLIYLGIRLMSGDRGPVIYTIMAIFLGYTYSTRLYFKKSVIIIIAIVGMTAVTVAGLSRAMVSTSLKDKMSFGIEAYQTVGNISVSPITMELAGSVRCNQLALKDINLDNSDFHCGEFQLRYLGTILFTNRVVEILFPTNVENTSSADYLTKKHFGGDEIRFGVGSSCIADFYLDLGLIGVVLGMLLVGVIFKKLDSVMLEKKKKNTGFLWVSLLIGLGSYSIYLPRSVFVFLLRIPLYMSVILYFNRKFYLGKANRNY